MFHVLACLCRRCCSLWVGHSCTTLIDSRSTVRFVPATLKFPRSWQKVKKTKQFSSVLSTIADLRRFLRWHTVALLWFIALYSLFVVFAVQLKNTSCSTIFSQNWPRVQSFPGWEKPQTAAFIHSGVLPNQTHPESAEIPASAPRAPLSHWQRQWRTLPPGR